MNFCKKETLGRDSFGKNRFQCVNGIVDALAQGMEAVRHTVVGGVRDGIYTEAGEVALP